ncbi:MAG: hypothetical protein WD845_09725 [Pirellulales bacterium]
MVRYLAYGAAALILVGAAAWCLRPDQYEVFAILRVSETPHGVLEQPREDRHAFEIFKRTQAALVTCGPVLRGAVREPDIQALPLVKTHDDGVAWLEGQIVVDFPNDAEIMRVAIKTNRPDDAIKVVDKVVEKYLSEVVMMERNRRFYREDLLKKKYESLVQDFKRNSESLFKLEQSVQSQDTPAGEVKRKLAVAELEDAIATRNFLRRELLENEILTRLHHSQGNRATEGQTADSEAEVAPVVDVPPEPAASDRVLESLNQQREFLQEKVNAVDERIVEAAKAFDGMERFSSTLSAQREELLALKQIMTRLKSEIDRAEIERLSQERVQLLDGASAAPSRTALQRYAVLGGAVFASLGLCFAGWASGRKQRLRNASLLP